MKKTLLFISCFYFLLISFSQNDSINTKTTNQYRFIKTDGGEIFGEIISQDEREILILTNDHRKIYLPQHVIKEIILMNTSSFNHKGVFIGEDKFSTRYFLTTNGLPIKKGEHYIQWNLFGPDFQFGLGKNLGVGLMTSWIGIPIIGTIKKSWELSDDIQFAIGGLIGTGSWASPDLGGMLPFGTISIGNRTKNIAISAGYGAIWQYGNISGRALTSIAGMIKISQKVSLVFDSFILPEGKTETITKEEKIYVLDDKTGNYVNRNVTNVYENKNPGFALFIPGIRFHQSEDKAIQFGFTGMYSNNSILSIPIPMIQWYRSL